MLYSVEDAQVVRTLVAEAIQDLLAHRRRERPSLFSLMAWAWGAERDRPTRIERSVVARTPSGVRWVPLDASAAAPWWAR